MPTINAVPSVERALALLECLADLKHGLSVSEISRRFSLPKSSVHLIAATLERKGYLRKSMQTGKYKLGLRLVSLSRLALEGLDLPAEARPLLQSLMRRTGLTVHMGVLSGSEAVLIEKVEAPGMIKLATWVGRRMDVHCTGIGKALIACLPEQEFNRFIAAHELARHNARTIVSPALLKQELARVREQGYSVDDEEDEIGLRCVGTPVFGREGQVVAAVSVAGTKYQMPLNRVPSLARILKQTAEGISALLGMPAGP
jgi:DNA-binding IclR family transcriptional regulator